MYDPSLFTNIALYNMVSIFQWSIELTKVINYEHYF